MSSRRDPFVKEANDTLKRVLITKEFRNHVMEKVTGNKPTNKDASLEWSLSNDEYTKIEDECNQRLASYITTLRHDIVSKLVGNKREEKINKIRNKHIMMIPEGNLEEYWKERNLLCEELEKYRIMSDMYNDETCRIVNEYIYSAESLLQNAHGCPLPVQTYCSEDYKVLVGLYNKHRNKYNLTYPYIPEEHIL